MFIEESGSVALDRVRVTIDTSGAVEVVTGAASVGQGVETVIAQMRRYLRRALSARARGTRADGPHCFWSGRFRLAGDGDDR
jgi:Molybdopterin-binding domain of aldehyde dehydrogenase